MRRAERRQVYRLMRLVDDIPPPRKGKGQKGQVEYDADMRTLLPMWRETMMALATADPDVDVEANLEAMVAWEEARKAENWANPPMTPEPYSLRREGAVLRKERGR